MHMIAKNAYLPGRIAGGVFCALLFLAAACSTAQKTAKAPLVGISSARSSAGSTQLGSAYSEAVGKAGGIPVVVPVVRSREEADAVLSRLDGIVFSGGEDVNPAWYGEEILNETVRMDSVRDRSDSLLARAAIASGKPILGICRGEQLMGIMLGGSLYQDIPTQIPETVGHSGGAFHMIGVQKGSVLARLFGQDSLRVNSYHHQALKAIPEGVRVTAYSPEGVVEAYETDQVLAVQFHPEKLLQQGELMWLQFFKEFVGRCR